jgi:threonine dehydratase
VDACPIRADTGNKRERPIRAGTAGSGAAEAQLSYISPYNDPDVIAGQGTIGEEIIQQSGRPPAAPVS